MCRLIEKLEYHYYHWSLSWENRIHDCYISAGNKESAYRPRKTEVLPRLLKEKSSAYCPGPSGDPCKHNICNHSITYKLELRNYITFDETRKWIQDLDERREYCKYKSLNNNHKYHLHGKMRKLSCELHNSTSSNDVNSEGTMFVIAQVEGG